MPVRKSELLPLSVLAEELPGVPRSYRTVLNWAVKGHGGHKLRTRRINGVMHSCLNWYEDWIQAQNDPDMEME